MDKNSKILIVGAGPVGLTLHQLLKKGGYTRVRHIDKSMCAAQESRAVGIHAFSLQVILKELGFMEEFKKGESPSRNWNLRNRGKYSIRLYFPVSFALSVKISPRRFLDETFRSNGE